MSLEYINKLIEEIKDCEKKIEKNIILIHKEQKKIYCKDCKNNNNEEFNICEIFCEKLFGNKKS